MTTPDTGAPDRSLPWYATACCVTLLAAALGVLSSDALAQPAITTYQSGTTTTFSPPAASAAAPVAGSESPGSTLNAQPGTAPAQVPVGQVSQQGQALVTTYALGTTTTFGAPAPGYSAEATSPGAVDAPQQSLGPSTQQLGDQTVIAYASGTTTTFAPPAALPAESPAQVPSPAAVDSEVPIIQTIQQLGRQTVTAYASGTTTTFEPPAEYGAEASSPASLGGQPPLSAQPVGPVTAREAPPSATALGLPAQPATQVPSADSQQDGHDGQVPLRHAQPTATAFDTPALADAKRHDATPVKAVTPGQAQPTLDPSPAAAHGSVGQPPDGLTPQGTLPTITTYPSGTTTTFGPPAVGNSPEGTL